ncbi:PAS domain-containing hybrid sensor histidine kinase/response regulator [Tenuifilum sp.]|uniref:PAS domain-containing hybrid sensor histidine kinase/response regulator n=1 Tax=Tenuifilum sp. TaxID=2760880 RepID=UPI00403EC1E6
MGGVSRVMAIVRDISDRKRTEQNFIESEQRFLRVMHFSKDAIGILDENFHFIDCNDSAARLHGFKSRIELLKNSPHPSALSPQTQPCGSSSYELANKMIEIALEQGFNKFEWLHNKVNGQKFWAEVSLTPIVFNGKRMIYAVWRDISDQKNKQNRIDRLLKILDESINEVYIFRCDNLKFIEFNKTAVNNLGYSPEELLELTPLDLKPYLTAEKFNELLKPLNEGTSSKIFFETIHRRKNGTEYPVEVYVEKTKASDADFYNAIVLDISQRKKHLAELKQREHELREIFDSTLEAILIYDIETGKIIDCNKQTQALYGYSKDELIGKLLGSLSANDEKYNIAEAAKWAKKALTVGPQTYTWLGKKKSGETFWAEISLKKSKIGGVDRLMAVVRDITERVAHQREIERREKEYREIFNATAEAILIYDPKTNHIVDCNNRAVELYGYNDKREFLSIGLNALGANVEPYTNDKVGYYSKKAAKEGPQRFDWLAKRKNGEHFWVEVNLRLTKIGGAERELIVIRDITDRKKFEDDLVKAKQKAEESDRLKSAFLANLSHEIRTPMNAIMGFGDLLKYSQDEQKRKEYIDIIQKSGFRLMDIINETVEIAKLDTGLIKTNPETFNLDQLMQDIYNELKIKISENRELELIYLPPNTTSETYIYTDRVKLQQILINLITNGIKYTPRGAVAFGYEVKDNRVVFKVKDTGIGIDRKNREMVFKRFFRVENPLTIKVGGIGLGLAITKAYTELLGGTIELDSELGKGTSVTVTLPYLTGEPKTEVFVEIPPDQLKGESELILVAEDDEFNFMYINEILRQFNYKCMRAANGEEAVNMAHNNENIKLILMDLKMPIMDGFKAFEEIRKFKPQIPIVAQTAYALGEDKTKIETYGFDGYLTKPLKKDELLRVVKERIKK